MNKIIFRSLFLLLLIFTVSCDVVTLASLFTGVSNKNSSNTDLIKNDPKYIIIEPSSLVIRSGEEKNLIAFVYMEDGKIDTTNTDIIWESEERGIADIDPKGKLKAVRAGEVGILAKFKDSKISNRILVSVIGKKLVDKIVITPNVLNMKVDDLADVIATVNLTDGTKNGNVEWSSSDNTIVVVNEFGKVSAKKEGTASIIATYKLDPSYKQSLDVNISKENMSASPSPANNEQIKSGNK
jgi:uncharacterized protein YjdB